MISYILAPNPTTQFTDNNGFWVANGFLATYDWNTRLPKATYYDPDGLVLRPNPIPLDSVGRQYQASQPIYWADDAPYYLVLTDANSNVIWESAYPFYPGSGAQSIINNGSDSTNLLLNGQMRFFPKASYAPVPSNIGSVALGGWYYTRNGVNLTTSLNFTAYDADDTSVDASPTYFLNYVSTGIGVGETVNTISFPLQDVRTLAGEEITISWNVKSNLVGTFTCSVNATQHFGTGGSPSADVVTTVMTINPTTTATNYVGTITLPTLSGETIGTNGDDSLIINFTFPLNTNCDIQVTNFYMKRGQPIENYPYLSYEEVNTSLIQNPATRTFNMNSTGPQSIPNDGAVHVVNFQNVSVNPQNWAQDSTGSPPSSLKVPTAGWWMFATKALVTPAADTAVGFGFLQNGAVTVDNADSVLAMTGKKWVISYPLYLAAGDYIQVYVQISGHSGSVGTGAFFTGFLICN